MGDHAGLILASTSRYRRALMDRLGLAYEAVAHEVDETIAMSSGAPPQEVALTLARAKAESLRSRFPDHLILGSDQVVALDGAILGKPGTVPRAVDQLRALQGRSHALHTAVALSVPGAPTTSRCVSFVLHMRALTDQEIARYVDRDRPIDCCGSYRIESLGPALFDRVVGDDPSAIEGLPLMTTTALLRAQAIAVP